MRVPVIAANWKMHKTINEAEQYAAEFPLDLELYRRVEVVICPSFTSLHVVGEAIKGTGIKLGAQNMHHEKEGAYTGEVSPLMLKDAGCSYVILGHSERRQLFAESSSFINDKVINGIKNRLSIILCVGETLEERKAGKTHEICHKQLLESLAGISAEETENIIIAYEPVWAIGTGVNASPEEAEDTICFIRQVLKKEFGGEEGKMMRILYGGSVKPDNITDLMKMENIDGALVGGASLKIDSFYQIIKGADKRGGE